ncbi:hypothetical protein SAMN05192565_12732 [Methylobacterium gossipiicola]|uniref:Uncharacterized protein n=1 Tax=Methylobacterium gossipiicola TaxID=582675 RepID=A0A1I2WTQ6_9HYPH|nr:hypothetical protein SAMN05192565_12732 [Methylobacterium gossipiicola]
MWWGAYATLGLSFVSGLCAFLSLRLNSRREQRDRLARLPLLDFSIKLLDPTACEIDCRILNRGETRLVVESLAVEGQGWHFETRGDKGRLTFDTMPVRALIEPAERFRGTYGLRYTPSGVAPGPVTVTLSASLREQGQGRVFPLQVTRHST